MARQRENQLPDAGADLVCPVGDHDGGILEFCTKGYPSLIRKEVLLYFEVSNNFSLKTTVMDQDLLCTLLQKFKEITYSFN